MGNRIMQSQLRDRQQRIRYHNMCRLRLRPLLAALATMANGKSAQIQCRMLVRLTSIIIPNKIIWPKRGSGTVL